MKLDGAGGHLGSPAVHPLTEPDDEATVLVDAPPGAVWAVIADVTRISEWSPVCHRVEWVAPSTAAEPGARFRGHNTLNGARWSRVCEITVAEPGRELSFSTEFKGRESTRWRYALRSEGGGTRVTESYEIVSMPRWVQLLRRLPGAVAKSERDTRANLSTSLDRLKTIVEGGPSVQR